MKFESEMETPSQVTAIMANQRHSHFRHAIDRLLYRLKPFVRAYPIDETDQMPEHDISWVTGIDDGPDKQIVEAIQCCPALWVRTLPEEVCIVHRKSLLSVGLSQTVVDYLAAEGSAVVESHAAHHLYESDERAFRGAR